jgi:hypothetical protein
MNTVIKSAYLELTYLASYHRWASGKSPHIGSRSPIDGRRYTRATATGADVRAYRAAEIAMSREYLKAARRLRTGEPL